MLLPPGNGDFNACVGEAGEMPLLDRNAAFCTSVEPAMKALLAVICRGEGAPNRSVS